MSTKPSNLKFRRPTTTCAAGPNFALRMPTPAKSARIGHSSIITEMVLDSEAMLGPYKVIERIGSGGMGSVYKAHDTRLDRTVAIKTLLSGGFSERFERESKALASPMAVKSASCSAH